ncbi:MAG TPA: hypothetical protein VKA46_24110 [Gemmataceae bacterium]|nr:hypothetical protein [Gemmataceae bacterium]
MRVVSSAGRVLRVVSFLTVLGFLSVVLVGPVLALVFGLLALVAGLLLLALPFALVGLLVWSAYLAAARDRKAAWEALRGRTAGIGRWLVRIPLAACVRLCSWGVRVGCVLAPVALPVARRAGEAARQGVEQGVVLAERGARAAGDAAVRARSTAQFVGAVLLEVIGGAAVGTILVCLVDSPVPGGILALHILGGAVAGAFLGLLVGAARSSLRREQGAQ